MVSVGFEHLKSGPPDPKSDALPPELRGNKGKLQKFLRIYLRLHPVIEFFSLLGEMDILSKTSKITYLQKKNVLCCTHSINFYLCLYVCNLGNLVSVSSSYFQ